MLVCVFSSVIERRTTIPSLGMFSIYIAISNMGIFVKYEHFYFLSVNCHVIDGPFLLEDIPNSNNFVALFKKSPCWVNYQIIPDRAASACNDFRCQIRENNFFRKINLLVNQLCKLNIYALCIYNNTYASV